MNRLYYYIVDGVVYKDINVLALERGIINNCIIRQRCNSRTEQWKNWLKVPIDEIDSFIDGKKKKKRCVTCEGFFVPTKGRTRMCLKCYKKGQDNVD